MKKDNKTTQPNLFIKEVCKYFMDFLETDFHKRRLPKRQVKYRDSNNLLLGFNTSKYPSFQKQVWRLISQSFNKDALSKVSKGVHKASISKELLDLIKRQISKLDHNELNKILSNTEIVIQKVSSQFQDNYEGGAEIICDYLSEVYKKVFVKPFIDSISESIVSKSIADDNDIYLIEEDLTVILTTEIKDISLRLLRMSIAREKVDIKKELDKVFNLDELKDLLTLFFEDFKVGDLFVEIFELEGNRKILDKHEFYLYFGEVTHEKIKYPVFYIPFQVSQNKNTFNIEFDAQVYINKKALEYITQEHNKETGKVGKLKSIVERIIYLAHHEETFPKIIDNVFVDIINLFSLDGEINILNPEKQTARGKYLNLSNTVSIALFDKADEALVNDYEEILQLLNNADNPLQAMFNKLIKDFLHTEPLNIANDIADEWDGLETEEKLVIKSPIPLNSEQAQILKALKNKDCKYVTVQGPPGTGKSHTITAIIFDAILKNKSTLVLSDKKEALDVVENKITTVLNGIRKDSHFQNPILRLGKTGNTYNQILSNVSVDNIRSHYGATKKDYAGLEEGIEKSIKSLKEELQTEISLYEDIDINNIQEVINLEERLEKRKLPINIEELKNINDSAIDIEELRKIGENFSSLNKEEFWDKNGFKIGENCSIEDLNDAINNFLEFAENTKEQLVEKKIFGNEIKDLELFETLNSKDLDIIKSFIKKFEDLKFPIIGYLFNGKKVANLDKEFRKKLLTFKENEPSARLKSLKAIVEICEFVSELSQKFDKKLDSNLDLVLLIHRVLANEQFISVLGRVKEDIDYIKTKKDGYKNTFKKLKVTHKIDTLNKLFVQIKENDLNDLIRYLDLNQSLRKKFGNLSFDDYLIRRSEIEKLLTLQMTYLMDQRFLNFYDNSNSTARTLRDIIKHKERFPRDEFEKVKEAFPCILAGIRDYAEYIPLEDEVFDLLIIDEASQVSLAQAFPALIRAKKVLILGDKKQFSNVKASQARSDVNREYLNNLKQSFISNISERTSELKRLEKFNIKTSILEFFEFIDNFNIQLKKHFRCYKEIISYSNRYFYQDSLEVTKIRGKHINEVINFDQLKHDGKKELAPKTNTIEVNHIVKKLEQFAENELKQSVGIITPHTNQQRRLKDAINKSAKRDYFFKEMNLGIWTFDTCQGEERDIVYYSMVANPEEDRLWGVFIKDLSSIDIEEDGKLKAQRLNVGFSRAKECVNFVISKPIDEFAGSIGEALRHYQETLTLAKKEPLPNETDSNSPMEKKVLNWLTQTEFYRENQESVELNAQFEIGKYLKQIEGKNYTHPNYRVDFLLIYKGVKEDEHKIIIEYDGFKEHFKELSDIDQYNYQQYYKDEDLYREKVLEGYGYKFLRINKFNLGDEPIETLNKGLLKLTNEKNVNIDLISGIHDTVSKIQNGEMKECPKCNELKELVEFQDNSLKSGYGRLCYECKDNKRTQIAKKAPAEVATGVFCPKCGAKMMKRNGRYGKFYGCSKFPYCKGTKNIT
ncbi:AAA domain-containing protein [Patescibacteria group bacterium]